MVSSPRRVDTVAGPRLDGLCRRHVPVPQYRAVVVAFSGCVHRVVTHPGIVCVSVCVWDIGQG